MRHSVTINNRAAARLRLWSERNRSSDPTLANHALALLAKLFRYRSMEHHGAFIYVAASRVPPLVADPKIRRALRRRGRRSRCSSARPAVQG
jgi:hypothetical protein